MAFQTTSERNRWLPRYLEAARAAGITWRCRAALPISSSDYYELLIELARKHN
jgi:hypothetical protein